MIQIHKDEYVTTLKGFCECIFPRNSPEAEKVLEAIRNGKLEFGRMQTTAQDLGVDYDKFNAVLRKLKDFGILTRNCTFSEVFENKIAAIGSFYSQFTGKSNPVQAALDDANEYLNAKGYTGRFEPQFSSQNEHRKDE